MSKELKPCPFCGSENIKAGAFSFAPDCFVKCEDCGAGIELEVPWGKKMSVKKHDQKCYKALEKVWNKRTADIIEVENKTQTNYDRIRNMSIEEMAGIIYDICPCCAFNDNGCNENADCKSGIKKWLESEVSENER